MFWKHRKEIRFFLKVNKNDVGKFSKYNRDVSAAPTNMQLQLVDFQSNLYLFYKFNEMKNVQF
ncbi:hypothetical protein HZS_1197 [Henneguya salminicola]|nr:hypothetical protein HZS_1197 [Henneguya salminicola]